jgi:uncharacterized protein (TIGR03382 family)
MSKSHSSTQKVAHAAITSLASVASLASIASAQNLITNGGFESGFAGWSRADSIASDGTFHLQSGTTSPSNGLSVAAPAEGSAAAMTDSQGPGSHALYQDFVVPLTVPQATLTFSLYVNNRATAFSVPDSLDWTTTALNQQARVDIMNVADPFSVATADVLLNAYRTAAGSALEFGYSTFTLDVTSLLAANAGRTLRLRFAEADNVNIFNFGVDGVSLVVIPTPAAAALGLLAGAASLRRRR